LGSADHDPEKVMLEVRNITKTYPGRHGGAPVAALRGVSFAVSQGDFFALLGPSGCGKTTMLQCIAGLEDPDAGYIGLGDRAVYDSANDILVPSNRRGLGVVFQSYAIWPHMTVFENVAFPLAHGSVSITKAAIADRVKKALDMVKLAAFSDRLAPHLSGGQQQRVALARALVHEPRLLLLDEPLSNLDAKLRDQMRVELRQLVKSLGISTLFVTHDQIEALGMSDNVALMCDGQIVQQGHPRDIYMHPKSKFAADFMGRSNILPGKAIAVDQRAIVQTDFGNLVCSSSYGVASSQAVSVVIRPHAVRLHRSKPQSDNCYPGRVTGVSFLGDVVEVDLALGSHLLKATVDPYGELPGNTDIFVELAADKCIALPHDS
jgi:iron(III) transport system ATP-binding protein